MSSAVFEFEVQARAAVGKAAARRLRSIEDRMPAIVYGGDKAPMPISLVHNRILQALDHEAIYSHILTLKCDGAEEQVVLKALKRHPFKPRLLHADFMRINANEKLTMRVPLHFLGETKSQGLKDGGVLSKLITDVEISCLPRDLPEFISVDISGLNIGDSIHLSQVQLPEKVEFLHALDEDHDQVVVSIHEPAAEEIDEPVVTEMPETEITGQKAEVEEGESKEGDAGAKSAAKPAAKPAAESKKED